MSKIIYQHNIIIRYYIFSDSLSDDNWQFYIEVPSTRVCGEIIELALDAEYKLDYENGTMPLSDLPIGSRVVDPGRQWEFGIPLPSNSGKLGVRPAINLDDSIMVSEVED